GVLGLEGLLAELEEVGRQDGRGDLDVLGVDHDALQEGLKPAVSFSRAATSAYQVSRPVVGQISCDGYSEGLDGPVKTCSSGSALSLPATRKSNCRALLIRGRRMVRRMVLDCT